MSQSLHGRIPSRRRRRRPRYRRDGIRCLGWIRTEIIQEISNDGRDRVAGRRPPREECPTSSDIGRRLTNNRAPSPVGPLSVRPFIQFVPSVHHSIPASRGSLVYRRPDEATIVKSLVADATATRGPRGTVHRGDRSTTARIEIRSPTSYIAPQTGLLQLVVVSRLCRWRSRSYAVGGSRCNRCSIGGAVTCSLPRVRVAR